MSAWFRRRDPVVPAVDDTSTADAYEHGQREEAGRHRRAESDAKEERRRLDEAYERGRREGRARRRSSPLLSFLLLAVVVVGGLLIYLAVRTGSFAGGGQVVDRNISTVAREAKAPLQGAADSAGNALQNAGTGLKQRAGSNPS